MAETHWTRILHHDLFAPPGASEGAPNDAALQANAADAGLQATGASKRAAAARRRQPDEILPLARDAMRSRTRRHMLWMFAPAAIVLLIQIVAFAAAATLVRLAPLIDHAAGATPTAQPGPKDREGTPANRGA